MMAKPESKNSADYWREREEEQRKHNIQEEKAYSQEIERIYRQMMNEIEIQIKCVCVCVSVHTCMCSCM